jgi:hypothetical protein
MKEGFSPCSLNNPLFKFAHRFFLISKLFLILLPSLPPFKTIHNFLGFSLYIFTITFHVQTHLHQDPKHPWFFTSKFWRDSNLFQLPNQTSRREMLRSMVNYNGIFFFLIGSEYYNWVNMCFQDLITSFQSLDLGTCLCFNKRFHCIFGNHLSCLEGCTLTMLWHDKTFKLNSPSWKARRIHLVERTFIACFRLMEPNPAFLHSRQQFVNLNQVHVKKITLWS